MVQLWAPHAAETCPRPEPPGLAREAAAAGLTLGGGPKHVPPNPLLLGLSPAAYVLRAVGNVKSAELEQALLVLPFTAALELLGYLVQWLRAGAQSEQCVRTATLLLRVHQSQLVATPAARGKLMKLHKVRLQYTGLALYDGRTRASQRPAQGLLPAVLPQHSPTPSGMSMSAMKLKTHGINLL